MRRLLAFLAVLLPAAACAQGGPVQQSGTVTPGHIPVWATNGVVQDAGPATNGVVTNIGLLGTGLPLCINDVPVGTGGGWQQLCFGANVNAGGALISYTANGGASPLPFVIDVNGTIASLTDVSVLHLVPFGDIIGNPSSSVIQNAMAAPLTQYLDAAFGTTQGQVIYRGASGWIETVPGANSTCLTYLTGPPISLVWGSCSAGGGAGTVTSVAMSGGTTGLTFSGGPITTTGTFTAGGTLAVANGGTGASSAGATAANNIGALAASSNLSDLTSVGAARSNLGLGTAAFQNTNNSGANLCLVNVSCIFSASGGVFFDGSPTGITVVNTAQVGTLTATNPVAVAYGGTGGASASTARTNLGLGTAATVNTGTSGATIPLNNGTNIESGQWTFNQGLNAPAATFGNQGSLPGVIEFVNLTSGVLAIAPPATGALATDLLTLPIPAGSTDTFALLGTPQTFTANETVAGGTLFALGTSGSVPLHVASAQTTAPALTSCGGGTPTIAGTDTAGTVTMGTSASGCVITFNVAYTNAPHCVVSWRATPLASQSYAVVAASITLTQTPTSSNLVDYICMAPSGG